MILGLSYPSMTAYAGRPRLYCKKEEDHSNG